MSHLIRSAGISLLLVLASAGLAKSVKGPPSVEVIRRMESVAPLTMAGASTMAERISDELIASMRHLDDSGEVAQLHGEASLQVMKYRKVLAAAQDRANALSALTAIPKTDLTNVLTVWSQLRARLGELPSLPAGDGGVFERLEHRRSSIESRIQWMDVWIAVVSSGRP
jgi:hypothetical protein